MRATNFSQPEGCWLLVEFLMEAEEILDNLGLEGELSCKFHMGCVDDVTNCPKLHQPSYNLVVYFNDFPIFSAQYELDKRFSLEVSEKEINRVEDFMANKTIVALGTYGLATCINHNKNKGTILGLTYKESEDKKFLSLN